MDLHTVRFIVIAAALYGLFHFGYHKVPDDTLREQIYPTVIGHPAAHVIKAITPDRKVHVRENKIASNKAVLNIVRGCDGSGVWFMLLAAVLGFGAKLKHTLKGLLLGTVIVYIINQIRIVGLYYLVEYDRTLFPAVHTYYAPTLIIFLIAGFFLWWTNASIKGNTSIHQANEMTAGRRYGRQALSTAIKSLFVVVMLLIAGQFWGERAIQSFFPFYEYIAQSANPDYQTTVRLQADQHESKIIASATALRALGITPDQALAAGRTIESSVTVWHTLVPLVILLTTCFVFPVQNYKQRLLLTGLTVIAVFFISAVTAPIQLLGNLEIGFINAAAAAGYIREKSWILEWMLLTEGGARWLIPLLTGIACGALAIKFFRQPVE